MVGWLPSSQELAGFLNLKYQFVMLTWPKPASVCYHPRLASPDLASHSFDYFMKGNCRHQHGHQSDLDRLGWTNYCKVLSCLLSVAPREMHIDKRWKESREREKSKLIHQHLGSGPVGKDGCCTKPSSREKSSVAELEASSIKGALHSTDTSGTMQR